MNRSKKRKPHRLLRAAGLLLLLLSIPAGIIWHELRQERLNQALLQAVMHSDHDQIKLLLHQGADPNLRIPSASPSTWRDMLHRLLHPASKQNLNDTVLMIASRDGDLPSTRLLLAAGANVNAVNAIGEMALSQAIHPGHSLDVIQALLEHSANPNVLCEDTNGDHNPALIVAIRTAPDNDTQPKLNELVRLLLARGADPNAADIQGDTALLDALVLDQPETAQALIKKGADVNHSGLSGIPLCICCASYNSYYPELLALMMQHGLDIAPVHNKGWNLLCWAAKEGDIPLMQIALQRGLKTDSRDVNRRTPLMYAAVYGKQPALDLLLARYADTNAQDSNGWTALMYAAQSGHLAIIRSLLAHGADTRLHDKEANWTAEQRAACLGQEPTTVLLHTGHLPAGFHADKDMEQNWGRNEPDSLPSQIRLDTHRRIDVLSLPPIKGYVSRYAIRVTENRVQHGNQFGADNFIFEPSVRPFHDVDGNLCLFLHGHHRSESCCIVAVKGRELIQRGKDLDYDSGFQPLPGGGGLIVEFDDESPSTHLSDTTARVSLFRHGKVTSLGTLYLPEQP